jgi:hypothetical protein
MKRKKNPAAVTLAKLRAKALSPERRAEIAREGAAARTKVLSSGRRREIAKKAAPGEVEGVGVDTQRSRAR